MGAVLSEDVRQDLESSYLQSSVTLSEEMDKQVKILFCERLLKCY